MMKKTMRSCFNMLVFALVLAGTFLLIAPSAHAQVRPTERQIRSYIPPDQLVSFRPETPFNQFLDFINPIFERVVGKRVIDPDTRTHPIGLSIAQNHYLDALEMVLRYHGLTYRETDKYFLIEVAPEETSIMVEQPGAKLAATQAVPATLETREIQISALLFSVNKSMSRDVGIDWNVFFGGGRTTGGAAGGAAGGGTGSTGSAGGTGGTGTGQQVGNIPRFFVRTADLADAIDNYIIMPNQFEISTLTQFFRFLEREGMGEIVANPRITVQSGQKGNIQIGTDLPFISRDFQGNTITQFVSTGIIVNVTPTLISEPVVDTTGSPLIDFIHLNVQVENSNGQVSTAGPIVNRNTANTQVLLLNGEKTIIGGLYSTEDAVERRGIPFLKDLPGWFFGIRYITGLTQRTKIQRELIILVQADLVDPLRNRNQRPFAKDLLERRRQEIQESFQTLSPNCDPKFDKACKLSGQ